MGIKVQYSGKKAIHTAGVDVGPDFIHLDLDGVAVELPEAAFRRQWVTLKNR